MEKVLFRKKIVQSISIEYDNMYHILLIVIMKCVAEFQCEVLIYH